MSANKLLLLNVVTFEVYTHRPRGIEFFAAVQIPIKICHDHKITICLSDEFIVAAKYLSIEQFEKFEDQKWIKSGEYRGWEENS